MEFFQDKFPELRDFDQAAGALDGYASAVEEVYMEIGMQCGAALAMQLLANPKRE